MVLYRSAGASKPPASHVSAGQRGGQTAASPRILIRCRIYFGPARGFSSCRNNKALFFRTRGRNCPKLVHGGRRERSLRPLLLLWFGRRRLELQGAALPPSIGYLSALPIGVTIYFIRRINIYTPCNSFLCIYNVFIDTYNTVF